MRSSLLCLTLVLILAGCGEPRSETARADAPEVAARPGDGESPQAQAGVEFEAPRLIPGIRAQMIEIERSQAPSEGNLTGFKEGFGTLTEAMLADLNRVGMTDTGGFRALGDSINREIGRGAGTAARVDRLIGMYEERMRRAAH
jgi:hypothetical protein